MIGYLCGAIVYNHSIRLAGRHFKDNAEISEENLMR
jgi:hypothetical protein